jgi:hypothetical protein
MKNLLNLVFFMLLMSLAHGAEKREMTIEIFQKDGIRTDENYSAVLQVYGNELSENMKEDDHLVLLVEKWKKQGVPLLAMQGWINSLSPDYNAPLEGTPCSKTRTSIVTQHNLSIWTGTYAWLLEQTLDCKFLPITATTTTDTLKSIQDSANLRLKEICSQPLVEEKPEKTVDISKYDKTEKLKLAGDTTTSPATLDKLSRDTNEDVQRAVAQNSNTAGITLKRMSQVPFSTIPANSSPNAKETPLPVAMIVKRHPKLGPRSLLEGNYLFLREKKKE